MHTTSVMSLISLYGTLALAAPRAFVHYPRNTTTTLDFGKCTDPGIVFGAGFDGRKEDSFEPRDKTEFNHGSALNIGVITGFIRDRLNDECAAPSDTVSAATAAISSTAGLTGQAAADAWNDVLGVGSGNSTSSAAVVVSSSASSVSCKKTAAASNSGSSSGDGSKSGSGASPSSSSTSSSKNGAGSSSSSSSSTSASSAACDSTLLLLASNVQNGTQADGIVAGSEEAGQSPSQTDNANFINFCTGKTLTDGLQRKGGSCNGVVMGDIPSTENMVSSIILNPLPGSQSNITAEKTFTVQVQMQGLQAGSFTDPTLTYYSAPQTLKDGQIVGHTHVTIQDMGTSLMPTTPLDPTLFAFFKGINDAGNGQGLLSATVTGGLPKGNYRICTMSSASNHQPVLMPVAQRGAQDDCTKFTVQ
ncbi:hypothetical protein UCRPC4_g06216 [Phaeomoniella chlamydospora]|uniref:Ribosomal protein s17 n=1 Tax=Phaeomoniella chlamydospora TaxID=158046 RepID=A0A0G2DZS9_PHACM|nr:hypothetical protein UCRPC4_g06216 [Phaeomoniella chlamydospora]